MGPDSRHLRYETPVLVDVEEVSGLEEGLCATSGGCGDAKAV